MKRNLLIVVLGVFAMFLVGVAQAEPLKITTGGETGGYFSSGVRLAGLWGRGEATVMPSAGGLQNIERLVKGEADVAFVQADTLAQYLKDNPGDKMKIESIGTLYEECAFLVAKEKGKVNSEDDLQSEKVSPKIAVGVQGSGAYSTFNYMRDLEPAYKASSVVMEGGDRALAKLIADTEDFDAYLFTIKPDLTLPVFGDVAKNKGKIKFIPVDDSDLNDKHPLTGKPVYRFQSVKVNNAMFGNSVETVCFDSMIIARKDLSDKELNKLSSLVLRESKTIAGVKKN